MIDSPTPSRLSRIPTTYSQITLRLFSASILSNSLRSSCTASSSAVRNRSASTGPSVQIRSVS